MLPTRLARFASGTIAPTAIAPTEAGRSQLAGSVTENRLSAFTRQYLARLTGNYTSAQRRSLETFFKTLTNAGITQRLDALWLCGFASSAADARVNSIKNAHTMSVVGSPRFVAGEGFTNFSTTDYLNTNYNPATQGVNYTQDNASFGFSTMRLATSSQATGLEMGARSNGSTRNAECSLVRENDAGLLVRLQSAGGFINRSTPATQPGLFVFSRPDSNTITVFENGVQTLTSGAQSSVLPPNNNFFIGVLNENGTPNFSRAPIIVDAAFAGASLTASQVSIFNNALRTLIPLRRKARAVFFGDSITLGQGATQYGSRWSSRVALLTNDWNEINTAIAGTVLQNTTPVLANNGRDRYITAVLNQSPEWVYILYGVNDLRYNGASFSAANYQNDLGEIVAGLIAGGIVASQIVIGSPSYVLPAAYATSPAPFDAGSTLKHTQYRDAALAVAQTYNTRYADIYQAMANHPTPSSLLIADGVHPNDTGHQLIADTFATAAVQ